MFAWLLVFGCAVVVSFFVGLPPIFADGVSVVSLKAFCEIFPLLGGVIAMKSAKDIAAKWARVTSGRSTDFADGVKAPRRSWAAGAAASEGAYKEGVTKAANEGRFGKGVSAAGDSKWQKKTVNVGVSRWAPGVAVAQTDMESGFAPYADVISKIELNPRYPKGDLRNYDRSRQIGEALNAKRISK